jgi:hypothetical protein
MRPLDHDYVNELVARLGKLRPDAKPAWGTLTPERMVGHLTATLRYSMGRGPALRERRNWFARHVLRPLVLNGVLSIPRNVKGPFPSDQFFPVGDSETFHAVLDEYLTLVQSGDLEPASHPAFGDLGIDGWAKLHLVHFEHHFRQFGL